MCRWAGTVARWTCMGVIVQDPYATWRSLDAEIGGPARERGHLGRSLRRHQHHPCPGEPAGTRGYARGEHAAGVRRGAVVVGGGRRDQPVRHRLCARRADRPGRHDDHRRLAGSHPVQPVLPRPGHRGQRGVARLAQPAVDHRRLQVHPAARRRAHPDHRERWRQGSGRQRRRDDRHLEASRRAQVVRRRTPHLRRLQVRVGMGHGQGQRRRRPCRLRGHHGDRLPDGRRHGHPLLEGVRGIPDHVQRAAAAPLPEGHPRR